MSKTTTDIAIIGAGPAGLFTVFQCGMLGLKCHVFDSLNHIGGQCCALYPEKPIYDIPAFPEIAAGELIDRLEAQAAPFAPHYHLNQQVVGISGEQGDFTLTTAKGLQVRAHSIIIAAGGGAFGPNRPPLANIEDYEGQSVFYAVRNRAQFAGKHIIIAGGGDSAIDWAIALCDQAKSVALIHRREKFRAAEASLTKLHGLIDAGKITLYAPAQLHGLVGENGRLHAVIIDNLAGEQRSLPCDDLLAFFGLTAQLGPIAEWGLALDHHTIQIDPLTAQTSQPGIYAVGDIATYPHKLKLILTGFAECAQAAHHIRNCQNPDHALHFEYSTSKGKPGL